MGGDRRGGSDPPKRVARASWLGSPWLGLARGCSMRRAGRMVVGLVRALVGLVRIAGMVIVGRSAVWLIWNFLVHGVLA